jgi:hypothetical protein
LQGSRGSGKSVGQEQNAEIRRTKENIKPGVAKENWEAYASRSPGRGSTN